MKQILINSSHLEVLEKNVPEKMITRTRLIVKDLIVTRIVRVRIIKIPKLLSPQIRKLAIAAVVETRVMTSVGSSRR